MPPAPSPVYFDDFKKITDLFAGKAEQPPYDKLNWDANRVWNLDPKKFAVFGPDDAAKKIAAAAPGEGHDRPDGCYEWQYKSYACSDPGRDVQQRHVHMCRRRLQPELVRAASVWRPSITAPVAAATKIAIAPSKEAGPVATPGLVGIVYGYAGDNQCYSKAVIAWPVQVLPVVRALGWHFRWLMRSCPSIMAPAPFHGAERGDPQGNAHLS